MKKYSITIKSVLFSIIFFWLPASYAGEEHDHSPREEKHDHSTHEKEHDHSEHEESKSENAKTSISEEAAKKAGIRSSKANSKIINEKITLTGRIVLNRNKTYPIRARYPGLVSGMLVSWGEKVKKGQTLARVDSNQNLNTYSIVAPHDGVIIETNTNVGDVAGEEPLFVIADLSTVWAEFHVFQKDVHRVTVGQKIRIHTLDNGKDAVTNISMLPPIADEISQTVVAIASINNEDGMWRPGLTVEADVEINKKEVDIAVSRKAIQNIENKNVVFVKNGSSTFIAKEVELGIDDGEYVEVISGLDKGEEYIIDGSFTVKSDILKSTAEHVH